MNLFSALLVVVVIPIFVSAQCQSGKMRSHPDSCEKYLFCTSDGVFVEVACPSALYFNPELNVCDWPYNVDCSIDSKASTTTTKAPTTPVISTTTPQAPTTTTTTKRPTTTTKPPTAVTVPLYRLFHPRLNNHFYTTNLNEKNNAVANLKYTSEGIAGSVSATAGPCQLKPIYRLHKNTSTTQNHFYTSSANEASTAVSAHGYIREGTAFYCAATANACGATKALYRYYRTSGDDHFYTTNIVEGNRVVASGGKFEGILCYIWA